MKIVSALVAPKDVVELESMPHQVGEGDVILTRLDGSEIRVNNVVVDSVGTDAVPNGAVAVESFVTDTVFYFCHISHWRFEYRFDGDCHSPF